MNPKRVWHDWKMVRTDNKQVWLVDEKLQTFDKDWEEVDSDATLETYSNNWEELESDAELYVYDSLEGTDIGSVEDYQWGWEWPFTIVWKNYDGTVLETDEDVEKDTTPTYDGATPTKPATAEYTYTFTGWNPEVKPATKNQTYTAQFEAVPIPPAPTYTITWKDYDETVLETDTVAEWVIPSYSGTTPTRPDYDFVWRTPTPVAAVANATYVATYTPSVVTYSVIWQDWDWTTLDTDTVEEGNIPVYSGVQPTREGYTFNWWSPTPEAIYSNQTYVAQYEVAQVNIDSRYLQYYSSIQFDGNSLYQASKNIPWANEVLDLDLSNSQVDYTYVDSNGQTTQHTYTDPDIYNAYDSYLTAIMDWVQYKDLTEEQFNGLVHLWEWITPDAHTYEVSRDQNEILTVSKKLGASVEESFTLFTGYGDLGNSEWGWYCERTINLVSERTTTATGTIDLVMNMLNNAVNNNNWKIMWVDIYNFCKIFTLNLEYINYSFHVDNNTYYSAKTFANNYTSSYVEIGNQVEVTENPDTITNVYSEQTYTITGAEATTDIAWIKARTAELTPTETVTEQDYYRFSRLWVWMYQLLNVGQDYVAMRDQYETYDREQYSASNDWQDDILVISQTPWYQQGYNESRYEFDPDGYTALNTYCTNEWLSSWDEITQAQYLALKAIFEQYKGDPIYQYNYIAMSDTLSNPHVLIAQSRNEQWTWNVWNRLAIEDNQLSGYDVYWIVNGATETKVWIMDSTQFAAFKTAALADWFDFDTWFNQDIQESDFINLKNDIESNMSHETTTLFSGANWTIIHDLTTKEIILTYTGSQDTDTRQMIFQDRDVWASEYLGESATASNAYWDYYCWGWPTPFNALPTNENQEDWSQVQTPAPTGYHIMNNSELNKLMWLWEAITWLSRSWDGNTFMQHLLVANAWRRDGTTWELEYVWAFNNHWLSDYSYCWDIYNGNITAGYWGQITPWYTLRCVKDVVPVSTLSLDSNIIVAKNSTTSVQFNYTPTDSNNVLNLWFDGVSWSYDSVCTLAITSYSNGVWTLEVTWVDWGVESIYIMQWNTPLATVNVSVYETTYNINLSPVDCTLTSGQIVVHDTTWDWIILSWVYDDSANVITFSVLEDWTSKVIETIPVGCSTNSWYELTSISPNEFNQDWGANIIFEEVSY